MTNVANDLPASPLADVSLRQALGYWFKLGCTSFGGPAGQIAMMHAELVERRRWISEQRFLHALNYCMVLPGPEATQLAIYIGWLMHKTRGGVLAGMLFVLPSALMLAALAWLYLSFGHLPALAGLLYGIKPAVVAIVLAAAWRLGRRTLRNAWLAGIAVAAFAGICIHLPFPLIMFGAALTGTVAGRWRPRSFQSAPVASATATAAAGTMALIGDDTPTPAHARFSWHRLGLVAAGGAGLGLAAWLSLAASSGADGPLARMGWFFTKAALLTFGGAYAVLPYLYQGGVDAFHWLTPAQMMDGLALGETTPGPLIIIVSFIGFVGAWNTAPFGPQLAAAGFAGALVATFFTFLPSFLFVLAGGPLVEASRGDLRLTAPLRAIGAAVVGLIASLALFFGRQILFPADHWDGCATAIAILASVALLRYQAGTIKCIFACAGIGLVVSYLP